MKISIILSTYAWPHALNIILAKLSKQLLQFNDIKLIIIDNGSTIETVSIINSYVPKIKNQKHV